MAAPKAAMTLEQWQARALELAEQHDMTHRARLVTPLGSEAALLAADELLFILPSSDGASEHTVRVRSDGRCVCDCVAGSYSSPCRHAGGAIAYTRQVVHCYSARGRRESEGYREFGMWLETRGY